MKKIALAVALASAVSLPALAQEALDLTPGALNNFTIIHDTRWFPDVPIPAIGTASSAKQAMVMGGNVLEAWFVNQTGFGASTAGFIYVSVSRKIGSKMQAIGSILIPAGNYDAGTTFNGQMGAGAGILLNEGDTLWVSNQGMTNANGLGVVTLRVAN